MKISCCDGRKLTATEQTAIDYINQNTELVAELSITEIAEFQPLQFLAPFENVDMRI